MTEGELVGRHHPLSLGTLREGVKDREADALQSVGPHSAAHGLATEQQPSVFMSRPPDSLPQMTQVVPNLAPLQTGLQRTFSLKVICHSSSQLKSAFNFHPFFSAY